MSHKNLSFQIIESLRNGIPPKRGTNLYSFGNEKLIQGIKRHLLPGIENHGLIRFTSGSWGKGKTHFFRILKDIVFENNCLVSDVELSVDSAALNRFESIFYSIIRNISSPNQPEEDKFIAPFGFVIKESMIFLSKGKREPEDNISFDDFNIAKTKLLEDKSIDIDFKKMIISYWETYTADIDDQTILNQKREEILQWFSGDGKLPMYNKRFGVNKMINKGTSKVMLQSLAGFVKLSGYNGLIVLFDEAEQSYSVMKKSDLKGAQNNLLSMINNIDSLPGLFLIYATTPDFYTDPKHGIVIYGALEQRIGKPSNKIPSALDIIWNLDFITNSLDDYQGVALKISDIYKSAFELENSNLPTEEEVKNFVEKISDSHPQLSAVGFWRILVSTVVNFLDGYVDGEERKPEEIYEDVMERLKNS